MKSFGSEGKSLVSLSSWDESGQREDYIVETELEAWCGGEAPQLKHRRY